MQNWNSHFLERNSSRLLPMLLLCMFSLAVVACSPVIPPSEEVVTDGGTDAGADSLNDQSTNDVTPVQCKANNDGVIELSEVAFVKGASVNVKRNKPGQVITVKQAGEKDGKGKLVWDFTALPLATSSKVQTVDPQGKWFLSEFPKAERDGLLIPVELPGYKGLLFQVLRVSGQDMLLDGLVSEKQKPDSDKILLKYDTSVPLLRFPLRDGKEWITEVKAKGSVQGLPVSTTEKYSIRVNGRGKLILPDIEFENTLRLTIQLQQRFVGGATRRFVQVLYMHECYGEIARIVSKDGETSTSFDKATLARVISF